MSIGLAPRAWSRSTVAAWSAGEELVRSRWIRFFTDLRSGTGTKTSGSPGSGATGSTTTSSGSSKVTSQPSAAAQNRAWAAGSIASTTRCCNTVAMPGRYPRS